MKQFRSLVLQFLYWMLVFTLQRAVFLLYYSDAIRIEHIPFSEVLKTFTSALKLDIASASYILAIPFFLLLLQLFLKTKYINIINKIYSFLVLFIYLLISAGELGLFSEWKSKLSYKAISYLRHPAEIFNSISTAGFFLLLILLIAQLAFLFWVYNAYFYKSGYSHKKVKNVPKLLFVCLVPGLLFLGARGGFAEIPITASDSYFSRHNILNLASVNNVYNLTFSIIDFYQLEQQNLFTFMPDDEARKIVKELHKTEKDTTIQVINTHRPNIVIIFLESWAADVVETLSGDKGISPEFRKLEKEGLLFTSFYATGNRSQQALASVFGGLPGIPVTTLTDNPQKYKSVPSLIKILNRQGYHSSFYFGGDLNYGNIKSYLIYNEFENLVDESNFEPGKPEGKLGFHDEVLFEKLNRDLANLPQPFFLSTLTLSSHPPYDFPGDRPLNGFELELDYLNSVHYTDKQLGLFFDQARKQDWYRNTLFIVLADHSHMSHKNYFPESFNYRHIPLLLIGGALKDSLKGKTSDHLCGNADLTSTILKQLNLPDNDFTWSKNIFNPYAPQFAFFELNYGFGWMRPYGRLETDIRGPVDYFADVPKDSLPKVRKEGQAYVQVLLQEFINY